MKSFDLRMIDMKYETCTYSSPICEEYLMEVESPVLNGSDGTEDDVIDQPGISGPGHTPWQ